ncbi:MAG TPA: hypothetical protein VFR34_07625, partial [Paracoccaceae bacterium]|nr:hypothetical protein [Paracoccaceae bacterium]
MGGSLAQRIAGSYGDVRASFRAERAAGPSEARLLFFAMLACGAVYVARLPNLMRDLPPELEAGPGLAPAFVGAQFVAHVMFGPLLLYGLAALTRLGARLGGGRGSWAGARLALFWALLLGAPVTLVAAALSSLSGMAGLGIGPVLTFAASLIVLWFWALCLAEAEGFA